MENIDKIVGNQTKIPKDRKVFSKSHTGFISFDKNSIKYHNPTMCQADVEFAKEYVDENKK